MPMYIIRWSHERVSLVHADDVDELSSILSERGDLDGVVWDIYGGPLWLDFAASARGRATLADEIRRAAMRAVERFMCSPPTPAVDEGADDEEALCWDDAANLLEIARDAWIADMNPEHLREALRGALRRLDALDAMPAVRSSLRVQ